jgi:hypothetical protein
LGETVTGDLDRHDPITAEVVAGRESE